jgi:hypothetical protein
MRYAIIENGKIFNIAEATPEVAAENGWVECPSNADIGWELKDDNKFLPPKQDPEMLAFIARFSRDTLLQTSDWTQVEDVPVNKTAWAVYRQALRDLPSQEGFPVNIVWPESPTS